MIACLESSRFEEKHRVYTCSPFSISAAYDLAPHNHPWLCCVGERVLISLVYCIMKSQNVAQHNSVDDLDSSFKSSNVNLNKVSKNHLFQLFQLAPLEGRSMKISAVRSNKISCSGVLLILYDQAQSLTLQLQFYLKM